MRFVHGMGECFERLVVFSSGTEVAVCKVNEADRQMAQCFGTVFG